jgi:hypothetical protein
MNGQAILAILGFFSLLIVIKVSILVSRKRKDRRGESESMNFSRDEK